MFMKYALITGLLFFISCKKDSVTLSDTVFTNTTAHTIRVSGYTGGVVNAESAFTLNANESKIVFSLNNRGVGNGLCFGEYYRFVDSIAVEFDGTFRMSHYKTGVVGNSIKKYDFSSSRNLFNENNYSRVIIKDVKYRREWNFTYRFTEQDYLDAK